MIKVFIIFILKKLVIGRDRPEIMQNFAILDAYIPENSQMLLYVDNDVGSSEYSEIFYLKTKNRNENQQQNLEKEPANKPETNPVQNIKPIPSNF
jgi:hypothetical protein